MLISGASKQISSTRPMFDFEWVFESESNGSLASRLYSNFEMMEEKKWWSWVALHKDRKIVKLFFRWLWHAGNHSMTIIAKAAVLLYNL